MCKDEVDPTGIKIEVLATEVEAGIRPAASVMIRNNLIKISEQRTKGEGLFITLNPRSENHTTVYIFKHSCVGNVVDFTLGRPYDKKALIQWIQGKMFGYPDEKINRFISKEKSKPPIRDPVKKGK